MALMKDLIGSTTRGVFRDLMTNSTVGTIEAAFQDEGFPPNPDSAWVDSSVRRQTTQAYLESIRWSDPDHIARFIRVAERLLHGYEEQHLQQFGRSLARDGYDLNPATKQITRSSPQLPDDWLNGLSDPSALTEVFERIRRSISNDPALAVGSAKEMVESTAKAVLQHLGEPFDTSWELPKLTRAVQLALGLDPSNAQSGPDGNDGVKRILGAVATIPNGLAQLRNTYGTGHGQATARHGLRPRHAHLAVNAAITWCQLVVDTYADAEAPWRDRLDCASPATH
jgi:Abortive infection C-terminus